MVSRPPDSRYHSLDSLRAVMMSLGVVIHGAVSYMTPEPAPGWMFRDSSRSELFDLLVIFIHVFRMPVFFVIAGFFSAFLFLERGEKHFIHNRLRRVAIPLAVFWVPLFPLVMAGFWYAQGQTGQRTDPSFTALLLDGLVNTTFIHMWFLYYLLLFYAAALIFARIPVPDSLTGLHDRLFRAVLKSPARALGLAAASAITLLPMETGMLDTKPSFIPFPPTLAAYGVYFAFGWLLFRARDLLGYLQKGAWIHLLLGIALFPVNLGLVMKVIKALPHPDPGERALAALTSGLVMGLLVFGLCGLFMRYLDSYNRYVRYFTDASYWVYLMHLPFAIWIAGWLAPVAIPAFAKFAIAEVVMFSVTLVSYRFWVRSGFLGEMLNGRRYPRGLPARHGPGSLAAAG